MTLRDLPSGKGPRVTGCAYEAQVLRVLASAGGALTLDGVARELMADDAILFAVYRAFLQRLIVPRLLARGVVDHNAEMLSLSDRGSPPLPPAADLKHR